MTRRVAVLVDGDNVSPSYQAEILRIGRNAGQIAVARVYMNARRCSDWHDAPAFRLVHSGTGKNATDILLAIDAIELALRNSTDVIVIASSDGDFSHLHCRLRELGIAAIGVGEQKTPPTVRAQCSNFIELGATQTAAPECGVTQLDRDIKGVIKAGSKKNGQGIPIADLNVQMRKHYDIKISTREEKTWRGYLAKRCALYDLDPKGPNAHVRFKPEGFSG